MIDRYFFKQWSDHNHAHTPHGAGREQDLSFQMACFQSSPRASATHANRHGHHTHTHTRARAHTYTRTHTNIHLQISNGLNFENASQVTSFCTHAHAHTHTHTHTHTQDTNTQPPHTNRLTDTASQILD